MTGTGRRGGQRRARRVRDLLPPAFVNLHKPSGVTSHDAVDFIRQLTGDQRVGHCGTLDPRASGVLPMCLGAATRLADHLVVARKAYRAVALLDVSTDTGDLDGEITARFAPAPPSREAVEAALVQFRGGIQQQVPLYSAVRVGGERLHELARAGEGAAVARPVREVQVDELELVSYEWPRLEFTVTCSKGTYVRQLAVDIGARLGVGGSLDALVRERVGALRIEDAVTPSVLAGAWLRGEMARFFVPWELALAGTPQFRLVSPEALVRLRQGRQLAADEVVPAPSAAGISIVVESSGEPLAVVEVLREGRAWAIQPRKVLVAGTLA